jgi:hypothetical protein
MERKITAPDRSIMTVPKMISFRGEAVSSQLLLSIFSAAATFSGSSPLALM